MTAKATVLYQAEAKKGKKKSAAECQSFLKYLVTICQDLEEK
jgi:hypothetical protein